AAVRDRRRALLRRAVAQPARRRVPADQGTDHRAAARILGRLLRKKGRRSDPAALPNVGRMASADDRAIAEPAKPDSHVMAVLASADDDGTRGDPADIGTMDTHAAGLAHRFTGAAGAAIPAVPAIPVPGPMIGVAAFDD